ncbi:minor capsid protein [Microbacterium sp. KSW-18]|uniref:Minor capsid protein n=1 Tax=Microbacterium aquilitoris TaxID=3067307 RepID=A0ABU3GL26_9MICO|nr:minor capsid protein [Microbacterium sp. KSW-18]MDT3331404.1 minor capsid protein [Microbacterium sp. KSW-18]
MDDETLTIRLCELLGTVPGWKWRPKGPAYTASEVGIFYGAISSAPDRAIGVRVYAATDDPQTGESQRRVQFWFRGSRNAPNGADKLASPTFAMLQSLPRTGGISGISRVSMVPQGADGNGRTERSDNYLITLDNLEALT